MSPSDTGSAAVHSSAYASLSAFKDPFLSGGPCLIVTALTGAGCRLWALNPMSIKRQRERHVTSGSKSDPGDAKLLADLVRTDTYNHCQVAGDSVDAEVIKVLAGRIKAASRPVGRRRPHSGTR